MSLRECVVSDKRSEVNERAVADLNSCLEQLQMRSALLNQQIETAESMSRSYMQASKRDASVVGKERMKRRAKEALVNRNHLQGEFDKASKCIDVLRRQVHSIVNSSVDGAIISAMRQYTFAARGLGLPDRAKEIDSLTDELRRQTDDVDELNTRLGEISDIFAQSSLSQKSGPGGIQRSAEEEDLDLERELNAYLEEDSSSSNNNNNNKEQEDVDGIMAVVPPSSVPASTASIRNKGTATTVPSAAAAGANSNLVQQTSPAQQQPTASTLKRTLALTME